MSSPQFQEIIDLIQERSGNPWIKSNILYLHKGGSHLYGTNRENSDIDIRGVYVKPKDYIIGGKTGGDVINIETDEVDVQLWEVRKFLKSVYGGAPNLIETVFAKNPIYERHLAELIKNIGKQLINKNLVKAGFGFATGEYKAYKSGHAKGSKRLMHGVRILGQLAEYLETGAITFPRNNTEILLAIKDGDIELGEAKYSEVIEKCRALEENSLHIKEEDPDLLNRALVSLFNSVYLNSVIVWEN